jgi:DNA (cytosine-5)-methyltransferase 1
VRVGSLFAGIGGFDLGLERAGFETAWQVELDPYRRAVLESRFPHAVRHVDVRDVGAHNLAPVEVICGGFPCQGFSLAGRGDGYSDARSGLWAEFARIVGELRPDYVLVENVPALRTRGLGRVLGDLAALRYDAEWDCLRACDVGAPHRRDRLWLVAYPAVARLEERHRPGQPPLAQPQRRGGRALPGQTSILDPEVGTAPVADAEVEPERPRLRPDQPAAQRRRRPRHRSGPRRARDEITDAWSVEPDVGRVADGVPARVDRVAALGDSLVPQLAEWIGRRILAWEAMT